MKLMAMKQALGMAQGLCGKGSTGSVELKTFKKDRWVSVCATCLLYTSDAADD